MKKIIFDYSIKAHVVDSEIASHDIENLNYDELKSIMNGSLFIFFEPQREYILLKTGVYDYLKQIQGVIEEIEAGNSEPFSVSCDWYSNNLKYEYEKSIDQLKIIEVNSRAFEIITSFKVFKNSFEKFYKETIKDILHLYPALKGNPNFK